MQLTETNALVFEKKLLQSGYKKQFQNFENSDFCFWKTFAEQTDDFDDKHGGYSIGFAFYDFTKFHPNTSPTPIHVDFHFVVEKNEKIKRMTMNVSDDKMTLEKFEKFCHDFYKVWQKKSKKHSRKFVTTN